jgi:predicted MFS family arabinose efflux permease
MEIIVITGVLYSVISGAVFVCGYSLIRMMFDAAKAGLYLGFASTCSLVGSLAGTPAMGLIADFGGWRMAYHAMWVIILIAAFFATFGVRIGKDDGKPLEKTAGKFDIFGTIGLTVFSVAIILFLSLGSSRVPFGTPMSWGFAGIALIGLIILIIDIRSKKERAIIPSVVLKDRTTVLITLQAMCGFFSSMAIAFFMATYIIYVLERSATEAGLAVTMFSIAGVVLSPILGRWLARSRNVRLLLVAGATVRCVVMLSLIFLINPQINILTIYVILFIYGFASCVDNIGSSAVPQLIIRPDIRIASNSLIATCRTFSANLGTAVYGVMIATLGVAGGIIPAFWISFGGGALSLILAFIIRNPKAEDLEA